MERTWRRRNYFIKRELQGKYIFSFFIFVITGSIIFTIIFSLLSADTLTIVYDNYNLQIGKTPLVLLREILSTNWIFIVAGGLTVVVFSMFLTHRFAGPMFRFEKSVDEMTRGNLNFMIHLRAKDEGKELAEKINRLILMLSSNLREVRHLSGEIDSRLEDVRASIREKKQDSDFALNIETASDLNRKLYDLLQKFTLKDDK